MEGLRHFRYILEGWSFTILTDHKPLVGALAHATDPWTACQCRHLAYVAEFTSNVQHLAGKENVVADALSRPPVAALVPPSLGSALTSDLRGIREVARKQCRPVGLPPYKGKACELEWASILCDTSTGRLRPLVPREDRRFVFEAIHGMAHE